ncbi:RagB/SusD family nutrient uptake outer membrane protein [Saccharicrinis carchari]|nr:RagB/SusD family nutrient uptake outer membrane protein [Saccharicrinis carchari]
MIKLFRILIVAVLLLTGCTDFLKEEMEGIYTSATFFQTDEHAMLALTAAYQPASFTSIENPLWVYGDVASDDAIKGGVPGDQSEIEFIGQFTYTRDNGFLESIWQRYYEGISRSNDVIYRLSANVSPEVKETTTAEAKFLRAYYYFHLVNIFGEIPLKVEPAVTEKDLHVPISSVAKIYEKIETDLIESAEALSATGVQQGRATKGAALGLLAKVYLFQKKYELCLNAIDDIELLGLYSLMPIYSHNFKFGTQNNAESLFEIQHLSDQDPFQGNILNQWFAPQAENGYFFNVPTKDFVSAFEKNADGASDPRLDYTLGREGSEWINGEAFDPTWSPTGYIQKKHLQPLSEIPAGLKGNGNLNYIFMRYAEILLIKAEALNELSRSTLALSPLNEVRKRARESFLYDESIQGFGAIPPNLLKDVVTTDQGILREIIRNERRVELGFEFHRFYDLMRYGKTYSEEKLSETNFQYDEHRFFPIPQNEVDINNQISN